MTTGEAGPGSRYRYRVDGADYPDPASRHQPDGVHGASEVIDPGAYRWRDAKWHGRPWRELAIYELHVGAFSETGDFTGAIAHLDHLAELGVTGVELMPIARARPVPHSSFQNSAFRRSSDRCDESLTAVSMSQFLESNRFTAVTMNIDAVKESEIRRVHGRMKYFMTARPARA